MTPRSKRRLTVLFSATAAVAVLIAFYVKTHPLVFNESFWGHAHCIKMSGIDLVIYAKEHGGLFPHHTNGYGDALLLLTNSWLPSLTGPGYDAGVFERALRTGRDVPESECGRVYVQGLSETNDPDIALLFDKLPTPGDHRQLLSRIGAPLVREVWTIGGGMQIVRESEWPGYARKQIALLVAAGLPREQAEMYYSEKPKK
jgi:hypothetical protein